MCSHYSVRGITTLATSRHFDKIDRPQDFSAAVDELLRCQAEHRSDDANAVLDPWVPSHRLGDPIRIRVVYQKLLWPKTPSALARRDKHPLAS